MRMAMCLHTITVSWCELLSCALLEFKLALACEYLQVHIRGGHRAKSSEGLCATKNSPKHRR